jgi:HEAT repeat protein
MGQLTYFCWHCYGRNERPSGRCRHCGREIAPPSGISYTDRLIWALDHPVSEVRMIAAQALGRRADQEAAPALRRLVDESANPFLAAQALRSLLAIEGVATLEALLRELSASAAAPVASNARAALERR